jgi:hypothetical protein
LSITHSIPHRYIGGYTCACFVGYTGTHCEMDVDDCVDASSGQPVCKNGAKCVDLIGGFQCKCPSGYRGRTCIVDVDECGGIGQAGEESGGGGHPCQHGGRCVNTEGSYECRCVRGYCGKQCESDDPCLHQDVSVPSSRLLFIGLVIVRGQNNTYSSIIQLGGAISINAPSGVTC